MNNEYLHETEQEILARETEAAQGGETPTAAAAAPVVQREERAAVDPSGEDDELEDVKRKLSREAELKRYKADLRQLAKEQKVRHKKKVKDALWALYGEKLKKVGLTYTPNRALLFLILAADGLVAILNSSGAISTAILKAVKWVLLTGAAVGVLLAIPTTRELLLSLLQITK